MYLKMALFPVPNDPLAQQYYEAIHGDEAADPNQLLSINIQSGQFSLPVLEFLLSYRPDLEDYDEQGLTVLQLAVMRRAPLEFIQTLINAGSDVRSTTLNGNALLDLAVRYNRPEVVDYIIRQFYFPVNQRNEQGLTPLHFAAADYVFSTDRYSSKSPYRAQNIQVLLQYGADPNILTPDGQRAFNLTTDPSIRATLSTRK